MHVAIDLILREPYGWATLELPRRIPIDILR